MFSSKLQLTAKVVANAAILAVVLLRDTKIFGSYVFASFENECDYNAELKKCEHIVLLVQGVVNLGEKVSAKGI